MTGLPSRALDVQLDLLRYYESAPGSDYAAAVVGEMFSVGDAGRITKAVVEDDNRREIHTDAREFGRRLHVIMTGTAETFAVTGEIVDVLEAASQSIPDYALHPSDLPCKCGFIYLERPIAELDRNGRTLIIRAISWHAAVYDTKRPATFGVTTRQDGVEDAGILVMLWTEPADERDHMHEEFTDDYTAEIQRAGLAPPHGMWSMVGGVWAYGVVPERVDGQHLFRLLMTFFRFIDEAWIDARHIDPERPLMRRAARADVQPTIKVIALRRRAQPRDADREPGPVDWQHRWLVRGHWRNQWYPSIQDHRPKWIAEHVKGPDDKPLVVHDKVFHVQR